MLCDGVHEMPRVDSSGPNEHELHSRAFAGRQPRVVKIHTNLLDVWPDVSPLARQIRRRLQLPAESVGGEFDGVSFGQPDNAVATIVRSNRPRNVSNQRFEWAFGSPESCITQHAIAYSHSPRPPRLTMSSCDGPIPLVIEPDSVYVGARCLIKPDEMLPKAILSFPPLVVDLA
jgi:hypothetical protein